MYSQKYQIKLKSVFQFEAKSIFGRFLLRPCPPLADQDIKLLNLGSGYSDLFEGWVNADMFIFKFWRCPENQWLVDLRYPLNCESNYWHGVFTEHAIEHLYPAHALNLFKEIYRTLKPECWLRVSVPDLEKYVNFYAKGEHEGFNKKWSTKAEGIWSLTQNFGHLSVWDFDLLAQTLRNVGFVDVRRVSFGEGTDKKIIKEKEGRRWESLYVEARKPA